jgi:hypothetical protein
MLMTTGVVLSGALRSAGYASAAACNAIDMQKNEAVLIDDHGGLAKKGNQEKKRWNLSLSPGEAGRKALGRSPGLGLFYSPRLPILTDSGLSLRLSAPLQWRDRAGFAPDFPGA